MNVSVSAENDERLLTNGEWRETLDERYENLRILNARERAAALEVFTRVKLRPPYLPLWSSAVLENGVTRVSRSGNIDLSGGS